MNYYSSKVLEFKNNTRKTWGVKKELIGKIGNTESSSFYLRSLILKKRKKK